jgi:hypothetical protein
LNLTDCGRPNVDGRVFAQECCKAARFEHRRFELVNLLGMAAIYWILAFGSRQAIVFILLSSYPARIAEYQRLIVAI